MIGRLGLATTAVYIPFSPEGNRAKGLRSALLHGVLLEPPSVPSKMPRSVEARLIQFPHGEVLTLFFSQLQQETSAESLYSPPIEQTGRIGLDVLYAPPAGFTRCTIHTYAQ